MCAEGPSPRVTDDWVSRIARLQPWYLLLRFPHTLSTSLFSALGPAIAIGIIGAVSICTGQPLVFPSLGPSAFLFFSQPTAPSSCPRNAILAHGSAILIGCLSYYLFVVLLSFDTMTAQILATAVSLGVISGLMVAANVSHAPAASTALIVSLGLMVEWQELVAVMVGILLLTVESYTINRLAGIAYPLWKARPTRQNEGLVMNALRTNASCAEEDRFADIAQRIATRQKLRPRDG